jgi:hypothetical protein
MIIRRILYTIFLHKMNILCMSSGRFGAVKSDSIYHFFGNACTKSGPIVVFTSFPVVNWFLSVCLTYEFCLSLWKIARYSVILLLPLFTITNISNKTSQCRNTDYFMWDYVHPHWHSCLFRKCLWYNPCIVVILLFCFSIFRFWSLMKVVPKMRGAH